MGACFFFFFLMDHIVQLFIYVYLLSNIFFLAFFLLAPVLLWLLLEMRLPEGWYVY